MKEEKFVYCPLCESKTRVKVRSETRLEKFPLYCPKCRQTTVIDYAYGKLHRV